MRRCCLIHLKDSSTCRRAGGARGATALVQRADGRRRQRPLVGQEHQRLARLGVLEADAPEMLREMSTGLDADERDGLIADDAVLPVGRCRVDPANLAAAARSKGRMRADIKLRISLAAKSRSRLR